MNNENFSRQMFCITAPACYILGPVTARLCDLAVLPIGRKVWQTRYELPESILSAPSLIPPSMIVLRPKLPPASSFGGR
jgi:hypothetical protein